MKNVFRITLVAVIANMFISSFAFALTAAQRLDLELRPFWDKTDVVNCPPSSTTDSGNGASAGAATPGSVYMVGDSITEGIGGAGVAAALDQAGWKPTTIDASVGRSISSGGMDGNKLSGLAAVDADSAAVKAASVIFVGLNTNPGGTVNQGALGSQIDQMIGKLRSLNPKAPIYWLSVFSTVIPDRAARNITLTQHATGNNVQVIDASSLNIPLSGGLHPTSYTALAGFVANAIKGAQTTGLNSGATANVCCAGAASAGGGPLTGADNAQKIFNGLLGRGLSPVQAAGLMGNLQAESGFRSDIIQGGGTANASYVPQNGVGFGIAQWTYDSRQRPLVALAQQEGKPVIDLGVQVDYLWQELSTSYKNSVLDPLRATSSVDNAVSIVLNKFEAPAERVQNQIRRVGFANNILQQSWAKGGVSSTTAGLDSVYTSPGVCDNSPNTGGGASANKIVAIAQQELAAGATEANGGNLKYTDGAHENWCSDFVSWVLNAAGTPYTGGVSGGWRIPAVASAKAWFQQQQRFKPARSGYTPQVGDIVIYDEGISPYQSHTAIVVGVNGNSTTLIGGNESNSVKQHTDSSFDASYITGYGQPK